MSTTLPGASPAPWVPFRLAFLVLALSALPSSAFSAAAYIPIQSNGALSCLRERPTMPRGNRQSVFMSATQSTEAKHSEMGTQVMGTVVSEHAKPVPVTPLVVAEDDNQAIGVISHHEAVELLHLREFYQVGVHVDS